MGYWGFHPMEGDTPLDVLNEVEGWLINTLISDIQTEESAGKNEKISDSLRNFVLERNFDSKKIYDDLFIDAYTFELNRDLWNTYKYDLIHQFKDEISEYGNDRYFVIPFTFIKKDIHVKSEYVPYLVDMLGAGGSVERKYPLAVQISGHKTRDYTLEDFKSNHFHPLYYVLLTEKYATQLFDESNDELNDEFVASHPEIRDVVSRGLFEAFQEKMTNTGEVPFMNVV